MSPKMMKILKFSGFGIVGLIVIVLVSSFIVKTDFDVQRTVVIHQPIDHVFDYIRYLENQYEYSVWGDLDPDMNREFRGEDGTVGFVSVWQGNEDVGRGEQEIVGIREGERIDYELRFYEPFESTSQSYMITDLLAEDMTRVTWGMSGSFSRPMNLMMLFFNLEEAIGSDYETGLNNLKAILEDPL